MEQQHLALLFDTFTERVTERRKFCAYEQGLGFKMTLRWRLYAGLFRERVSRAGLCLSSHTGNRQATTPQL